MVTWPCCYCCCHCLDSRGCNVAPWWPWLTARLQRSAGGRLLSLGMWSTHLLWGRPGWWCHWLLGGRPRDRLTWQLSALRAGTSSGSLGMWPKKALWRWRMVLEMDGRQVVVEISSFQINWCHLICNSCLWYFIFKASKALESTERVQVQVSDNVAHANFRWAGQYLQLLTGLQLAQSCYLTVQRWALNLQPQN